MHRKKARNEQKGTKCVTNINNYSHIIICLDENKETKYIELVNNNEKIDKIEKEYGNYLILSINELYNEINQTDDLITNIKVKIALDYAKKKHKGQYRHDGTEYIAHPIRVANYVKQYKNSNHLENLYIAALLHDVIEDSDSTYYDIVNLFGLEVASLVLEMTNDEDLLKELGKTKYLKLKMKNMSNWALVIKLCDRLDNTCDLVCSHETFRNTYINDTIEIINYILDNRKLTKTHLNIIKEIINRVYLISNEYQYSEYYNQISQIKERTNKIK